MKKNFSEIKIALVGFGLILLTVIVTIGRNWLPKKTPAPQEKTLFQEEKTSSISIKELSEKMTSKEKIFLLDLRDPESYASNHITLSENVSLEALKQGTFQHPLNTFVVIIGENGTEAELKEAFDIIKKRGFANVFVLEGGIMAWSGANKKTISSGDTQSFVDLSKVSFVEAETLKKILDKDWRFIFILDVRSEQEFKQEHLPGATNIPLSQLEKNYLELPLTKSIVICAADENQGFQAGVILHDLGFLDVQVIKNGLTDWKAKELPLTR